MRPLVLAAATLTLLASAPALAAKKPAAAAGAPAAAPSKGQSKMGACAGQWKAMTQAQKDGYSAKAKGMKSKKGGSLSGYNVWTGECMKK